MSYYSRKGRSAPAEALAERWLASQKNITFERCGAEKWHPKSATDALKAIADDDKFLGVLIKALDGDEEKRHLASRLRQHVEHLRHLDHFRYAPDYRVTVTTENDDKVTRWLDAKAGPLIERHCYEHYLHLSHEHDEPVYLAILLNEEPDALRIVKATEIVFAWEEWRSGFEKGSGTPCKLIDWDKTEPRTVRP